MLSRGKRYWFWSILAVLILALVFCGCGQKKEAQGKSGKTKITYMYAGGSTNDEIMKEATKLFEEKNPNIEVELIYVPNWGTYIDKITTSLASNTAPDVIVLGVYQVGDYVRKNALLDLTPYMKADQDYQKQKAEVIPETLWDAVSYNGQILGVPAWQNPDVMYYNKKLFDEAGATYPDATWDYQQYLAASQKLTKRNGNKVEQYGTWGLGWYWNVLWAYGADVLNKEGTECTMDTPQAQEAIQFIIDLAQKYHVAPRPGEGGEQTDYQAFMTGRVATFVSGHYMVPMLKDIKDFDWDISVLPHERQRVSLNNAGVWLVMKTSKQPQAAWEYVKFLSGPQVQNIIVKYENDVPILKSVLESDKFLNPKILPVSDRVYIDALKQSRTFPVASDPRMDQIISDAISAINLKQMDVATAMKKVTKEINQHLRER